MGSKQSSMHFSNIEQLLHSTVYVEVLDGDTRATGTAFFSEFKLPNARSVVVLVSCRHVFQNAQTVRYWIPIADKGGLPSGRFADITIELDGKATLHPNPNIDLAGVVTHHVDDQPFLKGEKLFYRTLPESIIPSASEWTDIGVGDNVYVPGCPQGLFDEVEHTPFVRGGIISNFPRDPSRPFFHIDIPTYDGSSGSPVIVDAHYSFNRGEGSYEIRNRFYLIGIVTDGLEVESEKGRADLHFGKAVKSDRLRELHSAILHEAQNSGIG